jgi:hypothetical protein
MILIAATAGGLALWRWFFMDELNRGRNTVFQYPVLKRIGAFYLTGGPIVLVETLGFLTVRLRQPRPRWRRVMAQPGTVSCVAAMGFLMFIAVFLGPVIAADRFLEVATNGLVEFLPTPVGGAVAMAWMILALSQRWRYEPGWIDTLGMMLGCYWVLGALIFIYLILV